MHYQRASRVQLQGNARDSREWSSYPQSAPDMVKRKTFALLEARKVMGIYDRDYYRRDGSGFMVFTNRGAVCKWLIAINVVVFVLQVLTLPVGEDRGGAGFFTNAFVLDPMLVIHGQVWRLFTYAFLHDPTQIMHILFNMLFLWWFGSDMEDLLGPASSWLSIRSRRF